MTDEYIWIFGPWRFQYVVSSAMKAAVFHVDIPVMTTDELRESNRQLSSSTCSLAQAPMGAVLDHTLHAVLRPHEMPGYRELCLNLPAHSQTDSLSTGQACFPPSSLEPHMESLA